MEPLFILIACAVTFIAGYLGSLAGGGGLIVTPVLLSLGLPAPIALGTRRFSALGGNIAGIIQFHRWKKINYSISLPFIFFTLLGAGLGFLIVDYLQPDILKKIIGVLIIVLILILFFEKQKHIVTLKGHLYQYRHIIGPPLATLASLINVITGGAGGTILSYILIIVYGQTILESAGTRKLPLLLSGLFALGLFMYKGYVDYTLALWMFLAHGLGVWFGSKFYLEKGEENIRIFFFIICIILAIKVLFF